MGPWSDGEDPACGDDCVVPEAAELQIADDDAREPLVLARAQARVDLFEDRPLRFALGHAREPVEERVHLAQRHVAVRRHAALQHFHECRAELRAHVRAARRRRAGEEVELARSFIFRRVRAF